MDEQRDESTRPVNPRRRRRTKAQIFKEAYLPAVIAAAALLLIVIFIIGSISRAVQKNQAEKDASIAASVSAANEEERLNEEQRQLLAQAEYLAAGFDYDAAIDVLGSFSGDMGKYPDISAKLSEYSAARDSLIAWNDPGQVVNLSFHLLIADPARAFAHSTYGSAFNRNYVTTGECARILQQLYDNGYILVDFEDIITTQTGADGSVIYTPKTLYLPEGKKPLMLTQTNVNYNIYMVDGDGDKLPDKDGAGFASRLILDETGNLTCEMVDSSGQTVTGAYDLVPILEAFVAAHPDFSYKGARATLALTGYNGLFGYRTNNDARELFGEEAYNNAVAEATRVANALRQKGYKFACYTYENVAYGDYGAAAIEADLNRWTSEALPILGSVDIMTFAQNSDIAESGSYTGDKYNVLNQAGFRYYLGFCNNGTPWATVATDHIRMGRILVSGSNMKNHADWFSGIFDPASVLDAEARG